MKTTLPFSTNIRKGIIHLVVGIIAMAILLNIYSNETAKGIFYDPNIATWSLLAAATNILGFYIHTFLLLPLLTFKKKRKQYIIYTLIGLIIFAYIINWFKALRSSEIVRDLNGTRLPASYFFFKTEWLFGVLVVALIVFVPIFLLSFIYHLFLISKQDRKKLLSVIYRTCREYCYWHISTFLCDSYKCYEQHPSITNFYDVCGIYHCFLYEHISIEKQRSCQVHSFKYSFFWIHSFECKIGIFISC